MHRERALEVGSAEVARFRGVDLDRASVDGRHRYVRVTIVNGDDAPLSDLRVRALAHRRSIVLAEGFGPPYRLYYGAPALAAPAYDFGRLPASAIGLDRARVAALGPESLNEDFEPPADTRTFFERNPNVVNGLLVLAAIVAAAGGMLALRRRA